MRSQVWEKGEGGNPAALLMAGRDPLCDALEGLRSFGLSGLTVVHARDNEIP